MTRDLFTELEMVVPARPDRYWLGTEFAGVASEVLSALGIAARPTVRGADA